MAPKEIAPKSIEVKHLPAKPGSKEITTGQGALDLGVDRMAEIQGVGMGVLKDGTPFLTQRGLARLCGVENAHIGTISTQWNETPTLPRIATIKGLLSARGVTVASPHIVTANGGATLFAYPDSVCLAVLEYYAFEAGPNCKDEARKNFRLLAGKALQDFIYSQVGYDPRGLIPVAWQQFHDRVLAAHTQVPPGYFSIFKEISDIIVAFIHGGADVGVHFIPDISVGKAWSKHWQDSGFDLLIGARKHYPHNYPDYFPQAGSNPQPAFCYPDAALGEFRRWVRQAYLPGCLPPYLARKIREGALPPSFSEIARLTFQPDE